MSTPDFKGYLAVITGGASGIGKAIAKQCCEEGINIAVVDINDAALQSTKKELSLKYPNLQIESFLCDCTNYDAISKLVTSIEQRFKRDSIEILFNNIGVAALGASITQGDLRLLHKTMNINVWSIVYLTQLFLPLLKKSAINNPNNNCYIVNTGSVASIQTADSFYGVTKHAVLALSETFERELQYYFKKEMKNKNKNIFVCCLCPGFVWSNLLETSQKAMKSAKEEFDISTDPRKNKKSMKTSSNANPQLFSKWAKDADFVAKVLFKGLKEKKFIVYPHFEWTEAVVKDRMESLMEGKVNRFKRLARVMKYENKVESKL